MTKEEKKVVVTGGTEGIGREIALELSKQGHRVALCARTKEKIAIMNQQKNTQAYQLDLSNIEKISGFIEQCEKDLGGITTLILNAAVTGIRESHEYTFKVVRDAQKELVNSAAAPLRSSRGRVIFLTSSQSKNFIPGHEHYGQAKKDVEDFLKDFSRKPENKNIHIFCVNPGSVDTRMNKEVLAFGSRALQERSLNAMENGKFRDPKIIGKIIAKISCTGKRFNSETSRYDIPISQNEIVSISCGNIELESFDC